ncbi:NepR family anti-sigma factor [Gluconobacter oxydans]|uniref:NepR family anti-sigma factor n=1 Tax=Gluconobacter oxydans TaxID=442 RepID=UPI0039EA28B7
MTAGDKRKSSAKETTGEEQDSPFGIWLSRGLHQLFDDVANEPIPDELLRLIEEDRNK